MKTHSQNSRGIALVVVLVFLVLLSVFIVGFFSNSQDELTAAQSFTGEVSSQQVAESAVSVVMGQIREATTRTNGAWGSQPGMIRVYRDGNNASSKADAFFKLYSSDDMIIGGKEISAFNPADDVPEGKTDPWFNLPALWTDLNEPAHVPPPPGSTAGQANRYPIFDPELVSVVDGTPKPAGNGVEGLELTTNSDPKLRGQQARMPVRWLYVLKDGTLTAPAKSSPDGTKANWLKGERAPSASNPIVGRVAFWTDDETSKLNINTAGGFNIDPLNKPKRYDGKDYNTDDYAGGFWDTPRVYTEFEQGVLVFKKNADGTDDVTQPPDVQQGGLAISQPVRGEYQRYPGHPATTSLGVVFRGNNLLHSGQLSLLNPRLQYSYDKNPTGLGPQNRGSDFGTARRLATKYVATSDDNVDGAMYERARRLYSSVDELFYGQSDAVLANGSRRLENNKVISDPNATLKNVLTPQLVDKLRFVLTANSRAPEINLFGRPRVTIWPVWEVEKKKDQTELWNASDRLIAFCSTIGPDDAGTNQKQVKRFLFQRKNAYSATDDAAIPRNGELYDILRAQTKNPFPGFGTTSFETKYGSDDRDQILTEMFDYVRSVNLRDTTRDRLIHPPNGPINGSVKAEVNASERYKFAPRGLVIPIKFNRGSDTVGFGRFPTISEAALVFYHAGYQAGGTAAGNRYLQAKKFGQRKLIVNSNWQPIKKDKTVVADTSPEALVVTHNLVRAFLLFETFNPMQGFAPTTTPNGNSLNLRPIAFELTGLNNFKITTVGGGGLTDVDLGFPATAENRFVQSSGSAWGGRNSGGSEGFTHTLRGYYDTRVAPYNKFYNMWKRNINSRDLRAPSVGSTEFYQFQTASTVQDADYPGVAVPINQADPERESYDIQFSAADLELKIKMEPLTKELHRMTLRFPSTTIHTPTDQLWADVWPLNGTLDGPSVDANAPGWKDYGGFKPGGTYGKWPALAASNKADYTDVKSFAGRLRGSELAGLQHGLLGYNGDWNSHTGETPAGPDNTNRGRQLLQPGDIVRSLVYSSGDLRVTALTDDDSVFQKHPNYDDVDTLHAQSLRQSDSGLFYPNYWDPSPSAANAPPPKGQSQPRGARMETTFGNIAKLDIGVRYPAAQAADLPDTDPTTNKPFNGVYLKANVLGDFDTGIGNLADGPFCGKADEGNIAYRYEVKQADGTSFSPKHWAYPIPYFTWLYEDGFDTFFTPNRQVPSPVAFGSLIAGKKKSWQTLCFSPNPVGADAHPGRIDPKDYLWLDLFTMPVVEPYAISEPFSTAGKVNMNYPIVPFSHIKRTTAFRGVLHSQRVSGFPSSAVNNVTKVKQFDKEVNYKTGLNSGPKSGKPLDANYRYRIDRDETLKAFDQFFAQYSTGHEKGFFKTAAQICDFYLYPTEQQTGGNDKTLAKWSVTQKDIKTWWYDQTAGRTLTGDNVREKPYGDLYPRLTTKSNTYCVHVRAQALRQSAAPDSTSAATWYLTWDEKRDRMIGEYRGSSIIERYIDPQDRRFDPNDGSVAPGTGINVDTGSVEAAYRFRVLNTKRFSP